MFAVGFQSIQMHLNISIYMDRLPRNVWIGMLGSKEDG